MQVMKRYKDAAKPQFQAVPQAQDMQDMEEDNSNWSSTNSADDLWSQSSGKSLPGGDHALQQPSSPIPNVNLNTRVDSPRPMLPPRRPGDPISYRPAQMHMASEAASADGVYKGVKLQLDYLIGTGADPATHQAVANKVARLMVLPPFADVCAQKRSFLLDMFLERAAHGRPVPDSLQAACVSTLQQYDVPPASLSSQGGLGYPESFGAKARQAGATVQVRAAASRAGYQQCIRNEVPQVAEANARFTDMQIATNSTSEFDKYKPNSITKPHDAMGKLAEEKRRLSVYHLGGREQIKARHQDQSAALSSQEQSKRTQADKAALRVQRIVEGEQSGNLSSRPLSKTVSKARRAKILQEEESKAAGDTLEGGNQAAAQAIVKATADGKTAEEAAAMAVAAYQDQERLKRESKKAAKRKAKEEKKAQEDGRNKSVGEEKGANEEKKGADEEKMDVGNAVVEESVEEPEAEVYTVEGVVAVGRVKRDAALHYKARWTGYGEDDDTWVHKEDMGDDSIEEFELKVPEWKNQIIIGITCGCSKNSNGTCISELEKCG